MTGFASKLINALFKKTSARPAAVRRRAALGVEPLEVRAVLSTVLPTTVADDVVVDGPIITGENFDSAQSGSGHSEGHGGGKVQMQDFHFVMRNSAGSRHSGGANFLLSDGSVRFISESIDLPATRAGAGKVSMNDFHFVMRNNAASPHPGGVNVLLGDGSVRFVRDSVAPSLTVISQNAQSGAHGGGGGAGKVSMRDWASVALVEDKTAPADIIVGAGAGAPGGHVKAFDGTSGAELQSFFAFQGFNGGVSVGSAATNPGYLGTVQFTSSDVNSADFDDGGHGTHVAGTIGSEPRGSAGIGTPTGSVTFFDQHVGATSNTKSVVGVIDTGIDYSHPDLYMNVWINQSLESIIDDLASEPTRHE